MGLSCTCECCKDPMCVFFWGDVDLEMFGDMSARMKTSFETKRIPLPFC